MVSRYLMSTTGWELVALLPAREAYAPLHRMQQRFLMLAALALALVAASIWLSVRGLLAPLTRLHEVVRDSASDLSAFERLPARQHRDEIGDLRAHSPASCATCATGARSWAAASGACAR